MERVKQGTTATISNTWYSDGAVADPGTVTVGVTRDDGTVLIAAGAATAGSGAAARTFNLTTTHTSLLDRLSVTWTSATLGTDGQLVEVVGDFLFTLAQARSLKPLDNTTTYPTAKIIEARTMVETALEDACGVAFVPRYKRQWVSGNGRSTVLLAPRASKVRSVKLDGVAVAQSYVDTMRVLPTGEVYYPSWWTAGYANYEVAYEHGFDYPPPRVTQAALLWAKNHLVKGPIDDRTTSFSTEDGTFSMATPGIRGSYTGLPEVDAVIQQYSLSVAVA